MLKIKAWIRGTLEHYRDTIPGPTPDQTRIQFEEAFLESDECYGDGDIVKMCPYFQLGEDSSDIVEVYVVANSSDFNIESSETPVLKTHNWNQFAFVKGGEINYMPDPCDDLNQVNICWHHDVKFCKIFYWKDVNNFDPKKLTVQYGVDQYGDKYFEELTYSGLSFDDVHDCSDGGTGYGEIEFIYHPDQEFVEESDDDQ
jgi:hypothetical protein